jgi:hypothetical protein
MIQAIAKPIWAGDVFDVESAVTGIREMRVWALT